MGRRRLPLLTDSSCHIRCCTLKNPHCSMAMSAEHRSKFAVLHRQWWRLHMREIFTSGTTPSPPKKKTKQLSFKQYWLSVEESSSAWKWLETSENVKHLESNYLILTWYDMLEYRPECSGRKTLIITNKTPKRKLKQRTTYWLYSILSKKECLRDTCTFKG